MSQRRKQLLTLLAAIGLVIAPLIVHLSGGTEFAGSDGRASDEISRIDPEHEPWFEPIWSPPGAETESLLFALQAALGAGVIGYVAGVIRTRSRLRDQAIGIKASIEMGGPEPGS